MASKESQVAAQVRLSQWVQERYVYSVQVAVFVLAALKMLQTILDKIRKRFNAWNK